MKLLLQSLGNKKQAPPLQQQVQIECLNGKFESTILEFFRLLQQPPSVPARRCLPGRSGIARWSRSLDDHPVTFEEAVIAGRGSRQLPVVGPQQLLASSGRIYFLFFKSDSSNRKSFQMHKPPSLDEFFPVKIMHKFLRQNNWSNHIISGRGRGLLSATKRELPQPRGLNVQGSSHPDRNFVDSDEEEDWC